MKILAFTDPHGSKASMRRVKDLIPSADIIVCAGDLTSFGSRLSSILNEMNMWGKPVLLIPGNHEEHLNLKMECTPFPNIHEIDRDFFEFQGALFIGYGRGGFSHITPQFDAFARKIKARSSSHQGKRIMVFHQPPFGTELDRLEFGHVGNETFAHFIAEYQPELMLCGHIHECFGNTEQMGKTLMVNPGPNGILIEI
jgi:uncharacterized protein